MEVAVILKQFPDRRFMVAGHTDNQPVKETFKDNWELSMARALVVTRFLVGPGHPWAPPRLGERRPRGLRPAVGPRSSPESTLAERFAKGDIDETEYRARLEVLRANRPNA